MAAASELKMSTWTVFSNHGHVLLFLAGNPEARLRDVAENVGITERAVQKIVKDLQDSKVISVHKHGRRNRYRINGRKPLRHELEAHKTVGNLIKLMVKGAKSPDQAKATDVQTPAEPGVEIRSAPVNAATPPVQSPDPQGPDDSGVDDAGEYTGPDLEPDHELVPVSAYDPFEESPPEFDEAPQAAVEPEVREDPKAVPNESVTTIIAKEKRVVDSPPEDSVAEAPAKKVRKPAKKGKPTDEQQGSLF